MPAEQVYLNPHQEQLERRLLRLLRLERLARMTGSSTTVKDIAAISGAVEATVAEWRLVVGT
jgi:hypothetical protein